MKLWQCHNSKCQTGGPSGFPFANDAGKCPKCGVTAGELRVGFLIVQCVIVHLDPPDDRADGVGKRVCACDGQPIGPRRASGHWKAVNCPTCKETAEYKAVAALDDAAVHPDFAVPLAGDAKTGRLELVAAPATKTGGCG